MKTDKPEDAVEAFQYALFRFDTIVKLMKDHPDWSAADIDEVSENMWLDHKEAMYELEQRKWMDALDAHAEFCDGREDSYLIDRENAREINRS